MASFDELLKKANQTTQPTSHFNDLLKKANEKRAATAEDQALFDSFKSNAENYFNSFKTDADALNWGTSASTYQKYSGMASDLFSEGNKLKNTLMYLDIDEEQKSDMHKYIDDVLTSAEKGTGNLKQANDYYSQFGTQEEFDTFIHDYKEWEYANSEEGKQMAKEWENYLTYIRVAVRMLDTSGGFNGIQEARDYLIKHDIGYPLDIKDEGEMKAYLEEFLAKEDAKKDAQAFVKEMHKYETEVLTDFRIQKYKEAGGKDYAKSLPNDDQMSENERLIYNILKSEDKKKKGGGTRADVYADFIQEYLNQKKGVEIAKKLEDKTALQELYGVWAGISNWGQGIGTFFTGNTTPSATQYASGMIRQELENKNKNWAALYDVSSTVGQMLPSIAVAYVTGGAGKLLSGASKGAGTVGKVGSFLQTKGTSLAFRASFGASAYGNAYSQMVNLGYNENQAKIYATLSASSEVLLDSLIGGISGFTGKLTGKSITKAAENIDNAFLRIATSGLIRNMGEFTEESLQTVLEPLFKRIATGEVDPVNWGEAIYSGVLGFATSAILGLPGDAFKVYTAAEEAVLNKAINNLINTSKDYDFARTMPEYSASYKLANVIKNKGTAYNLISEMAHLGVSLSEESQNTIKQSLLDLGYSEEVAEMLVGAINTVTSGGNITNAERNAIEINPQLSALLIKETVKNDVNKFGLNEEYKNFEEEPVNASEIIHEKITKKLPESKAETNRSKVKYDKDSPVGKISDVVLSRKADSTVTDAEVEANKDVVSRIGKALGYEVIYDDGTVLGKVNGRIDFENKKITLNTNVKNPVQWILKHEIGHYVQDTKAYADFVRKVRKTQAYADWLRAKTGTNDTVDIMEAVLNRKTRSLYEEAGQKLGGTTNILTGEKKGEITEANEEIISDFIADELFSGDTTNLENFLNELDKPTRNKFIQWILDIIDTIKQSLTKGDKKIEAELTSLERQFTDMLKDSQKELAKAEGSGTRQSYSSIVHTFFGVDGMSTEEFMSKDYKKTEGYKELVETSLNNMRQSRENFDEKTGIHETGKQNTPTQFYKLNEEYVKSLTQKDINGIIEAQGKGTDFERGLQYVNAEGESDYTERINEVYRQFNEGKITEEQRDSMLDSLIADARKKYGTIEQGESVTGDEDYSNPVPESVSKETKNRRFVRTVTETGTLTKEMLRNEETAILSGLRSFTPTSNKENLEKAIKRINNGQAEDRWRAVVSGNTSTHADDIALGELMLAGAIKNGDAVQALKLTAELSEVGTRLGQAVQALSLLKRMGGLGELYYVKRAVDTLNKNFEKQVGRTDFKQIKINEELSLQLLESKTEPELERAMEAIMKDVASQVPATFIEKWNAWRYMSMLANPKTLLRNLAGNLVFSPAVMIKNAIATVGEMVIKPEERTKTFIVDKQYKDFAKENWDKTKKIIMHGGKYSPSDAIQEYRRVFKNPALEGVRKAYGWALEAGDEVFIGGYYRRALSQYLAANKVDINNVDKSVLAKAEEYAAKEALKNTYRDASYLANKLNSIARNSWFGQLVVEGVIPFKKTPINIIKRSVEYSPVGLIHTMGKGLINLKKQNYSGSQIIDSLAGGLTGTGIMLVGMFCAKALIANFGFDDEDEWWKKMNGEQEFAIKIGDSSYTVDWMAPAVVPFFIGVSLMEGLMAEGNENVDFAQIAASSIIDPVVQLSMLQGVQESLSSLGGYNGDISSGWGNFLTTVISSYLTQGVPTLLGKVAYTMDDKSRRNYIEKDSKVPQWVQMVIKKTQAKIPWLSDNRTPYVNAWGEDEKTGPLWERIVEGFVSPGYFSKATEDDITREITRLYKSVGDKKVLPVTPEQKISFKGYKKALKEQEYYQLSVETGRKNAELMAELLQHEDYDKLSDSSKVAVISAIYNWSLACAKANLLYTFEEIEKMEVVDITEAQYNALKDSSKQAIAKEYFLNETLWKQERKNGTVIDYLIDNEIKNSGKKPKDKASAESVIKKFS